MSTYEEQFKSNDVHDFVDQLAVVIRDQSTVEFDEEDLASLDKLAKSQKYISNALKNAMPTLVTTTQLNSISVGVKQSIAQLGQLGKTGNKTYLRNAASHIDKSLDTAKNLIQIEVFSDEVTASIALSFQELANKAINELRANVAVTEENSEAARSNLTELRSEINSATKIITDLEKSVVSEINDFKSKFGDSELKRSERFEKIVEKQNEEFKKLVEAQIEEAEIKITELETLRGEAENIVNMVGNIGLTGNYQGAGSTEKTTADNLRGLAIGCFILAAFFAFITMLFAAYSNPSVGQILMRLGAGLFILLPGTYAARESAKHRARESLHSRTELELATINPYIKDLPVDQQHKIKSELVEKYFVGVTLDQSVARSGLSDSSLIELLKQAIKGLSTK